MQGTTKLALSRFVVAPVLEVGVVAPGILVVGVLLMGCRPPI